VRHPSLICLDAKCHANRKKKINAFVEQKEVMIAKLRKDSEIAPITDYESEALTEVECVFRGERPADA
jgi:hypothetical protein